MKGYDVIVLPKSWFFEDLHDHKFDSLARIINTAYDKPKDKYGIIKTQRIKYPQKLADDLQYSKEKDAVLLLLLGLKEKFSELDFHRDFQKTPFLPLEMMNHFGAILDDNANVIYADSTYSIDKDVEGRVLTTVGFKTYSSESKPEFSAEFEITAFTSFLKGIAPKFFEFLVDFCFKNARLSLIPPHTSSVSLYAVVIRDHDLVPYYTKFCGFETFGMPDMLVSCGGVDSPLEGGIEASRDFHLAFLRRTIKLGTN